MDAPTSTPDQGTNQPPARMLGRLPAKSTRKALQFSDFFKYLSLPKQTKFWTKRPAIPLGTWGNDRLGDCTRAKQAIAAIRMERLEQRRTITITDEEVIRVYQDMTTRLYGGGDTGAYEDDALNEWRRPDTTFRDTTGHPYTIDAFLRINATNQDELKAGIALAGAKGIAVCFNLPAAWDGKDDLWDAPPAGTPLIGLWQPGSLGGHSMWCFDYTSEGPLCDMTWNVPPVQVTWDAAAIYLDEAHLIIDSVDSWRQKKQAHSAAGTLQLAKVVAAVNDVSEYRIG